MTPERRYREAVNERLALGVYNQAMGGTATNGTPDEYYEKTHVLWVEYKWSPARNPRVFPDSGSWALQKFWLKRAHNNGQQVAVICGCPLRGYVFLGLKWESRRISDAAFSGSKDDMAAWISNQVR